MTPTSEKARVARLITAAAGGFLTGCSTFGVGPLSSISDNRVLGLGQKCVMLLLLPGLIGSGAVVGNVHAFSLALAACINFLFTFALLYLICSPLVIWRQSRMADAEPTSSPSGDQS